MITSDDETLTRIRTGVPLDYSYDAYGAGRVNIIVSWDAANATFMEERTDRDMDGNIDVARRAITEESARRHVHAQRAGGTA